MSEKPWKPASPPLSSPPELERLAGDEHCHVWYDQPLLFTACIAGDQVLAMLYHDEWDRETRRGLTGYVCVPVSDAELSAVLDSRVPLYDAFKTRPCWIVHEAQAGGEWTDRHVWRGVDPPDRILSVPGTYLSPEGRNEDTPTPR